MQNTFGMDYLYYKTEDFAADETFIAYHLKTDPRAITFWENWGRMHPEKLDEIAAAERLIDLLAVRLPQHEFEQEKEKVRMHIDASKVVPMPVSRRISNLAIAACLTLLLGVSAVFFLTRKGKNEIAAESKFQWLQLTTPNGKKSRIQLSDGSVIVLNGGSTLHYPKIFSAKKREVRLEGEAYFSVSHNPEKPFIVHTGALDTEVLGTEFNISTYKSSEKVSVALVKGKVKVSDAGNQAILTPGRKAEYNPVSKKIFQASFDIDTETGWRQDKLVFKNADFATVARAIEKMYGFRLVNQSLDKAWRYTGTFNQQTVVSVVENICFSKHLTYRISKQTIYLSAEK